MSLKCQ